MSREVPQSRHGELVTDAQGRVVCHECGRAMWSLPRHLAVAHEMSADRYREVHGLARTLPLVSERTRGLLHAHGVRRRDEDPRVLEALTGPAAQAQRAAPGPRVQVRSSTRAANSASKREQAEGRLRRQLAAHGWEDLPAAVAHARQQEWTWGRLARELGCSHTPLARRGRALGLDLPTHPGTERVTRELLDAAREHARTHGSLCGTTGRLARWLGTRRYLAAREAEPSTLTRALDQIDPRWRAPRR